MKGPAKAGLVVAGYVVAALVASAAVAYRVSQTSGPDAQASAGMYAFGDAMLFLAMFGAVSVVPTGLAFYFLRPFRWFWVTLALLALAVAATALVAAGALVLETHAPGARGSTLDLLSGFGVLRLLVTPLLGGAFVLGALFAPGRLPKRSLLLAALLECAAALYFAAHMFLLLARI